MMLKSKALLVGQKAGDGGQSLYTFRATTEVVDRQGEIVTLDGWDFGDYESNPVILDSHDYQGIKNIVGRAIMPLRLVDGAWEVDILFSESNPKGQLAKGLADEGMLRAVSVGFASLKRDRGADGIVRHTQKSMLEISVVSVPANHEAIRVRGLDDLDVLASKVAERLAVGGDESPDESPDEVIPQDEPVIETKAGRTLSKKNEDAIKAAMGGMDECKAMLAAVLDSMGKPMDEGEPPAEDGSKAITTGASEEAPFSMGEVAIKADLSALMAFVGNKEEK